MDDKRSKAFNAHQGKFRSQWLNVVPCKNLGLKLDDQQLRISIGLGLGANICVAHTCHCGKRVERDGLHGLSCTKSAGRFSRHATLSSLMKQTLGSLDLPSMLEPRGLYRTNGWPKIGRIFLVERTEVEPFDRLQGSNGMRSNFIEFVVWLSRFAPSPSSNIEA